MRMTKRIFLEMAALAGAIFCTMHFALMANAAELDPTPPQPKTPATEETKMPNETAESATTMQGNEEYYAPYYNESLPIAEVYSNVDPATTKFVAIEYGESTEEPMLAAYTDDPNWGDHRQFARMVPVVQGSGLTAGDAVARIKLYPDMSYSLVEYLVNTATEGSDSIEGLKLFIDFPQHLDAGSEEFVFAYLNSDNDAGGSRVCWIAISSEEELWLTNDYNDISCQRAFPTEEAELKVAGDQIPYLVEAQLGMQIDEFGNMRTTMTIEWPEACEIVGGTENGYFAMLQLSTHSSNPFVQEIVVNDLEEFEAAIADDPDMQQGYIEDEVPTDILLEAENSESTLTKLQWAFLIITTIVTIAAVAVTVYIMYWRAKLEDEDDEEE